jgi:hypothetical protein
MRNRQQLAIVMLVLSSAVATTHAASILVPAGTTISVRMTNALDSKTNRTGEIFRATVDSPLAVNGKIVVPKGAEAIGRVTEAASSHRFSFKGRPLVAVELTALNFEGKSVAVRTGAYQQSGVPRGKQSAIIIGGSTLLGVVAGVIGGAPWLGTRVGAAAGMAVQTVRGPGQVRIPAESVVLFTLQSPLPVDGDF